VSSLIHPKSIVILDFGGQYAHLIANRVRRLGAFSEIHEPEVAVEDLKEAAGIILSGGPQSVYDENAPKTDPKIFELGIPVLGICYGHQWMAHTLGGKVKEGKTKEYGYSEVQATEINHGLLRDLQVAFSVWMSHGDEVSKVPEGFTKTATSDDCAIAAMAHDEKKFFGLQFHPEVTHTEHGMEMLQNFVDTCHAARWKLTDVKEQLEKEIKETVGDRNVFILVSGGVDSTVAMTLLNRILGVERVYGLLIDHGLMRKGEVQEIEDSFEDYGFHNLHIEDASAVFTKKLKKIYDPEEKRRIIGNTFLEVQKVVAKRLELDGPNWILGQGTIYPDTIETGRTKHSAQIKTHHNRVDAIEKMIEEGKVIEPLKDLYKDEVRELGEIIGLPHHLVHRHPFPGPGLGVRMLCSEKPEDLSDIETPEVKSEIYSFQLLPVKSVGVQGDSRSYKHPLVIYLRKPFSDLRSMHGLATSLPNAYSQINRVLVCTSHQEPIEFAHTPSYITRDLADLLREADHLIQKEMIDEGLYEKIWQFPVVLLPIGEKEGNRSIVLRPVESQEAMTANAYRLSEKFLMDATEKLLKLSGIDMVFYDVTNKPPGTIEWE
jgi:GMP synthase (glutamine-hydrolysing)